MRVAVDHDAVAATVAQLALTVRGLERELDALDAAATQLKDTWTGDAQNAYERAHREWSAAICDMKTLLAEATLRLITANAISGETAATATGVWT
ncbi:WXG100 family type VII secretion target [Microbacterium sp. NPDC058269]|uniref:WXG100 family type VII secretion target n=1 Tax=Microbacterium sp. NPDC058269 TaxID=3346414 RepID=UPI0036DBA65C